MDGLCLWFSRAVFDQGDNGIVIGLFFFFNGYFHVAFNDDQTKYFVPVFFFFLHLRLVPWLDSSIEGEKKKQAYYGMFKFSMVVRDNNNNRSKNRKKIEVLTSFFILTKLYSSIKTIGSNDSREQMEKLKPSVSPENILSNVLHTRVRNLFFLREIRRGTPYSLQSRDSSTNWPILLPRQLWLFNKQISEEMRNWFSIFLWQFNVTFKIHL